MLALLSSVWWFLFDVCLIYDIYGVLDSKTGELGWGAWDQVISTELHIARASFRQPHAITTFKAISHAWAGWRMGSLERPHLKSQRLGKKWILVIVSICTVPGVACWLPQDDFWHLRGSRKALKPLGRTKQSPGWQPPLPQPHARTHQYWPDKNHNSRGFPPFSGAIKPFPMMNHSNWTTNWLDGFMGSLSTEKESRQRGGSNWLFYMCHTLPQALHVTHKFLRICSASSIYECCENKPGRGVNWTRAK